MATENLEERVADAIDLIHSVRFVAGEKTSEPELDMVWGLVRRAQGRVHLRYFQKCGISSTIVAKALRAGVLVAIPAGGK